MIKFLDTTITTLMDYLYKFTGQKWHKTAFMWGLYISYILFALTAIGTAIICPSYLSIFLIIRFNPFTRDKVSFDQFDAKVAYTAGVFLLLTTVFTSLLQYTITYLRLRVDPYSKTDKSTLRTSKMIFMS
jgi:hypothetical protein